eukprot:TRINITY_DN11233_c0_g2_i7.p2 TRINITY_DN11233_c0_g2~~TRINITY_DN11233_c0_g2_i7.p2  ORF type:complete len:486 (+),score=80.00 TRINITY_DN11233_c0_g2_i7:635-2092(+)
MRALSFLLQRTLFDDLEAIMNIGPRQRQHPHVSRLNMEEVHLALKYLDTGRYGRKKEWTKSRRNLLLCHPCCMAPDTNHRQFVSNFSIKVQGDCKVVATKAGLDHLLLMATSSSAHRLAATKHEGRLYIQGLGPGQPCAADQAAQALLAPLVLHSCTKAPNKSETGSDHPSANNTGSTAESGQSSVESDVNGQPPGNTAEVAQRHDEQQTSKSSVLEYPTSKDWTQAASVLTLSQPYFGQPRDKNDLIEEGLLSIMVIEEATDLPCQIGNHQQVLLVAKTENLAPLGLEQMDADQAVAVASSLALHPQVENVVIAHLDLTGSVIKHLSRTPSGSLADPVVNHLRMDQRLAAVHHMLTNLMPIPDGDYILDYRPELQQLHVRPAENEPQPSLSIPIVPASVRPLQHHFVKFSKAHVPFTFVPAAPPKRASPRRAKTSKRSKGVQLEYCNAYLQDGCADPQCKKPHLSSRQLETAGVILPAQGDRSE